MSAITPRLSGARIVDLFAGSGALGLEALSRGASHATFVESAAPAVRTLRSNAGELGVAREQWHLRKDDVFRYLQAVEGVRWEVALADPPYTGDHATRLLGRWTDDPFAAILCLEHDPRWEPATEPSWHRRYGDSALSFFSIDDD